MTSNTNLVYGNLALDQGPLIAHRGFEVLDCGRIEPAPSHRGGRAPHANGGAHSLAMCVACLVLVIASIALGLSILGTMAGARGSALSNIETTSINVSSGDSLWSIAEDHGIEGLSTRDVSDFIREANGLESATLHPGMSLVVPAD